jgi:hypothetical protein
MIIFGRVMGNLSKLINLNATPLLSFPYNYVYYVIDEIYNNQDTPANKLTYTPLGQSHSQAICRSANK